jgi:hypothetical protein
MLETQRPQDIRASHNEKARKPSPSEFFSGRADKSTEPRIGECYTGIGIWHGLPFLPLWGCFH